MKPIENNGRGFRGLLERVANIKTGNSRLLKDGILSRCFDAFLLPNRFLRKLIMYFFCIWKPTSEADRRNEHA